MPRRPLIRPAPNKPQTRTPSPTQSPRIRITRDAKACLRRLSLSVRSCPRMHLQSCLLGNSTCEILDARRRNLQRRLGRCIFVGRMSLGRLCMRGASLWDSFCSLSGGSLRSFSAHRARVLLVMKREFHWMIRRSSMVSDYTMECLGRDDECVDVDAKTWRFRCRVMSVVSLFTYTPFIILVVFFVRR